MENLIYVLIAIIGLFVAMQIYVRLNSIFKKGKKIEGVKGKLGSEIRLGNKVLVYFYTNSCAACKPMTPVIDRLKKDHKNIYKVNLSNEMDTARAFGVMGTPATILVKDEKVQSFNLGAKTENYLRNLLN